jgi:hypothetical protein
VTRADVSLERVGEASGHRPQQEFVAREFERLAGVPVRIREGLGDEGAQIFDIQHLERNVWLETHRERAVLDRLAKALEVLREEDGTNDRCGNAAVVDRPLDLPLGVEVRNPRIAFGAAHGGEDEMVDPHVGGEFDDVSSLLDLGVVAVLPEVRHQEDAVGVLDERFDRVLLADVGLDDLRTAFGEGVCPLAVVISGQRQHVGVSLEQVSSDGAALRPGRAHDEYGIYSHSGRRTTDERKKLTRRFPTGRNEDRPDDEGALLLVGEQSFDHLVGVEPL